MYLRFRKLLNTLAPNVCPAPLKYSGAAVVMQEVPDEISLAISITGCKIHCPDCHSKHLWEYTGRYLYRDIDYLIDSHPGITCVAFMGGDQNLKELSRLCRHIRRKHPHLKICVYTGTDEIDFVAEIISRIHPDYIKYGSYKTEFGPLTSPNTNQRFCAISYPYGYDCPYTLIHDCGYKFLKDLDRERIKNEAAQ